MVAGPGVGDAEGEDDVTRRPAGGVAGGALRGRAWRWEMVSR